MKKLLFFICLIPFITFSKPKRTQFRIRIIQRGSYVVYIPENKIKMGLFGKMWYPIEGNGGYFTEREAIRIVNEYKYEDSLRTIYHKTKYMYF